LYEISNEFPLCKIISALKFLHLRYLIQISFFKTVMKIKAVIEKNLLNFEKINWQFLIQVPSCFTFNWLAINWDMGRKSQFQSINFCPRKSRIVNRFLVPIYIGKFSKSNYRVGTIIRYNRVKITWIRDVKANRFTKLFFARTKEN